MLTSKKKLKPICNINSKISIKGSPSKINDSNRYKCTNHLGESEQALEGFNYRQCELIAIEVKRKSMHNANNQTYYDENIIKHSQGVKKQKVDLIINPKNNKKAIVSYDNPNDAQNTQVLNSIFNTNHIQNSAEELYGSNNGNLKK
jgi:hypothetical protein